MNKQKFIDLLVSTDKVTETDLSALEEIAGQYPYFQSGHTVLAKASRVLKSNTSSKKLATAAIYSTNRNIFKQYIDSNINSVDTKPHQSSSSNITSQTIQTTRKAPEFLNNEEQSELINDIYKNLKDWKSSRDQYLEFDKAHPEDIVIEDVETKTNEVEVLKSQVAKEVEAEDVIHTKEAAKEKLEADILDDIKTQVAKEALKEEVEELEKELNAPKVVSEEKIEETQTIVEHTTLGEKEEGEKEEIPDTSGSVYSFNKPIPEPQSLPEIDIENFDNNTEEEEEVLYNTNVAEDSLQDSNISEPNEIEVSSEIENPEEEEEESTVKETSNHVIKESTPEQKKDKHAPEIEDLNESNEDLISSEELSAIVDKINDEVEEVDSEENIVVEELSDDNFTNLESQIESIDGVTESGSKKEVEESIKSPDVTDEIIEEEDDSDLPRTVNFDDVKKLDPEEVFEANFSDEDIDFSIDEKETAETKSQKNISKENSLESLSVQELESFEIEPSLEDISNKFDQDTDNSKSEKTLGNIDKEKSDLKLTPGAFNGEKKFRLSVMKRPHNFTRPKKVLNAREARTLKIQEEAENLKKANESEENIPVKNKPNPTRKKTPSTEKKATKTSIEEKPKKTVAKKAPTKKISTISKAEKKPKATTKKTKASSKTKSKENDTESVKKKTVSKKPAEGDLDHQSIIDSFIETNPSIRINKNVPAEIENTVDLSSDSLEFPQELTTENLATILKNQGKFERAIEIYEKLILNNPKKKAYFASQIENLKKN